MNILRSLSLRSLKSGGRDKTHPLGNTTEYGSGEDKETNFGGRRETGNKFLAGPLRTRIWR